MDLKIKLTKTVREKQTLFTEFFTCTRESSQENEDQKKGPEQGAFMTFRQRINTFAKN